MRIPSSFTEDNLYRRQQRRPVSKSAHSRLLRLGLAMVLVVVVMRQAGNPRIYEVFFTDPTSHSASGWSPELATNRIGGTLSAKATGTVTPLDKPLLAQIARTVASLDDHYVDELMTLMAAARTAQRGQTPQNTAELPTGQGASAKPELLEITSPKIELPGHWIDRLNEAFNSLETSEPLSANSSTQADHPLPNWTRPEVQLALQAALDQWALARVDPAAVWKGVDSVAFYRLLEPDPNRVLDDRPSRTSVTSLIQQPEVYLRRRIIIPASVARSVRKQAADNPFGVTEYWEVWLRPRDGSERPLVLYTHSVAPEIAAVGADAALTEGPAVWIDGVFLKRIAYRSTAGRELAPGIVGTAYSLSSAAGDTPTQVATSRPNGWLLLASSALIGCSLAAVIFIRSRTSIARARDLRRQTRQATPPFIESLTMASPAEEPHTKPAGDPNL